MVTLVGTNFGGSFQATQRVDIAIADMDLDGYPDARCHGQGHGSEGGLPPAIDSFFDIFIDEDLAVPANGRAVVKFVIRSTNEQLSPPGHLLPVNPAAPPGSIDSFFDIFVDDSFFDITYRVADPSGDHTYHSRGESPGGRMSFFDVFVELPLDPDSDDDGYIDSFFDVFVDFRVSASHPCPCPTDICLRTNGTFKENPVPVVGATWTNIKNLLR